MKLAIRTCFCFIAVEDDKPRSTEICRILWYGATVLDSRTKQLRISAVSIAYRDPATMNGPGWLLHLISIFL
jgi:hypothetical protein